MSRRAAFFTLGCKVNQNEAESLKALFRDRGYEIVSFQESAEVYVIHTCTVTHLADRKSRQMIRRSKRKNPESLVVVSGCYAQVSPEEVKQIEGVDLILGTKDRRRMVDLVEQTASDKISSLVEKMSEHELFEELPTPATSRTRSYLKVQEGCNQFCTYCIVPYARGPVRSRMLESAYNEACRLVGKGYKEIVLTGIHLGSYGYDLERTDLNQLLLNLETVPGLERLRISSLDPHEFTPEILKTISDSDVICPHFHIPLQSGDEWILERMGRRHSAEDYLKLVDKLKGLIPEAAITTDVIVGFPGENEKRYQHTRYIIEKVQFSDLHVFKYSPRKGTPAADYTNQVSPEVKDARSKELISLGRELKGSYASKFTGQNLEVLVETEENGILEGHTKNYLRVKFEGPKDYIGSIMPVKIGVYKKGYSNGRLEKF